MKNKLFPTLAALALLAFTPTFALANPCSAPCGTVVIAQTLCQSAVATAEGRASAYEVNWTFIVHEEDGGQVTTTTLTSFGYTAAFEVPATRGSSSHRWGVWGELQADGVGIAWNEILCPAA